MQNFWYYFNEITNFILEIFALFVGAWVIASIIAFVLRTYIEKYCEKINVNLNKKIYVVKENNKPTELPSFEQEFNPNYEILEKYITKIQVIHAIIIWVIFIIIYYDI
jgi:hypothetical protein